MELSLMFVVLYPDHALAKIHHPDLSSDILSVVRTQILNLAWAQYETEFKAAVPRTSASLTSTRPATTASAVPSSPIRPSASNRKQNASPIPPSERTATKATHPLPRHTHAAYGHHLQGSRRPMAKLQPKRNAIHDELSRRPQGPTPRLINALAPPPPNPYLAPPKSRKPTWPIIEYWNREILAAAQKDFVLVTHAMKNAKVQHVRVLMSNLLYDTQIVILQTKMATEQGKAVSPAIPILFARILVDMDPYGFFWSRHAHLPKSTDPLFPFYMWDLVMLGLAYGIRSIKPFLPKSLCKHFCTFCTLVKLTVS